MSYQIGIKICLNQEIHRVSQAPADLKSLKDKITILFAAHLPKRWALQYVDYEGDTITMSDELDFTEFLEEGKATSTKIFKKVYIIAVSEHQDVAKETELQQEYAEKNLEVIVVNEEDEALKDDSFEVLNKNAIEPKSPNAFPPILEVLEQDEPRSPKVLVLEAAQMSEERTSVSGSKAHNRNSKRNRDRLEKKLVQSNLPDPNAKFIAELQEGSKCLATELKEDLESFTLEEKHVHEDIRCDDSKAKNRNSKRYADKVAKKLVESGLSEPNSHLTDQLQEANKCLTLHQKEEVKKLGRHNANRYSHNNSKNRDALYKEVFPSLTSTPLEERLVHEGIRCDGCRQSPMIGVRYKCSQCADFDYCERCEAKLNHPHPFIQMKKAEQTYVGSSSSSSHISSLNLHKTQLVQERLKQPEKKWKPLPATLLNFETTFEDYEDEEYDDIDIQGDENQHEKVDQTLKRIYASEIQEKVQKLSEIFADRRIQAIYDFVSKAHHLSLEALVEKWILLDHAKNKL